MGNIFSHTVRSLFGKYCTTVPTYFVILVQRRHFNFPAYIKYIQIRSDRHFLLLIVADIIYYIVMHSEFFATLTIISVLIITAVVGIQTFFGPDLNMYCLGTCD